MSDDPARNHFFAIQAVRLSGVACTIAGMAIAAQRIAVPVWLGYLLVAIGLVAVLVIPTLLARRWRTPK